MPCHSARSSIAPVSTTHLPWPRLVEFLVVVTATAPGLIDQGSTDPSPTAWSALSLYIVVAAGALMVRRLWPLTSFGVMLVTLACAEIWCAGQETQLSNLAVLPLAFSVYAVGAYCRLPVAVIALAAGASVVLIGVAVNHATAGAEWRGGSDVFATIAPLPVTWALGVVAQSHRLALEVSEQRAADNERERRRLAELAVAAERGRIARDMHDVVAHSLTLLVVHAETIRVRSDELPPWARDQIDSLAAAGRQATVEMRELLGVLRKGNSEEAVPRAPAPTLTDVPSLVESARSAGNPVMVKMVGSSACLPKPVQLTGYRVLQESLANARRHAPGSRVHIEVTAGRTCLAIEVLSHAPLQGVTRMPGEGTGLIGLEERVGTLGGTFSAESVAEGFRVTARIPLVDSATEAEQAAT